MSPIRTIAVLILFIVAGCAKLSEEDLKWKDRVGSYTYDHALEEFGRPSIPPHSGYKKRRGYQEGDFVASWNTSESSRYEDVTTISNGLAVTESKKLTTKCSQTFYFKKSGTLVKRRHGCSTTGLLQ